MSKAMKAKTDVCFLSFSEGSKGHTSCFKDVLVHTYICLKSFYWSLYSGKIPSYRPAFEVRVYELGALAVFNFSARICQHFVRGRAHERGPREAEVPAAGLPVGQVRLVRLPPEPARRALRVPALVRPPSRPLAMLFWTGHTPDREYPSILKDPSATLLSLSVNIREFSKTCAAC